MPFVNIDLFEGRTREQKEKLALEVAESVHRNTGAPMDAIHVTIREMAEGEYFPAGRIKKLK
jgi:4-oxalocrotonate tautomerase